MSVNPAPCDYATRLLVLCLRKNKNHLDDPRFLAKFQGHLDKGADPNAFVQSSLRAIEWVLKNAQAPLPEKALTALLLAGATLPALCVCSLMAASKPQAALWAARHMPKPLPLALMQSAASSRNPLDLLPGLVALGMDINQRDPDGRTILHLVSTRQLNQVTPELFTACLTLGADPHIQDKDGKTFLDYYTHPDRRAALDACLLDRDTHPAAVSAPRRSL